MTEQTNIDPTTARAEATARPWEGPYPRWGGTYQSGATHSVEIVSAIESAPIMSLSSVIYEPDSAAQLRANAELIVTAVNAFDQLVAALQAVERDARPLSTLSEVQAWEPAMTLPAAVIEQVRAALALADDVVAGGGFEPPASGL